MNREEIIRMAREAGLAYGSDEKPLGSVIRFAALVAAAERNKVAQWIMDQGYATGHGETVEDLLKELTWQIQENEREACAKVAESFDPNMRWSNYGKHIANTIRNVNETREF
jgi:hypothetical protein